MDGHEFGGDGEKGRRQCGRKESNRQERESDVTRQMPGSRGTCYNTEK